MKVFFFLCQIQQSTRRAYRIYRYSFGICTYVRTYTLYILDSAPVESYRGTGDGERWNDAACVFISYF